MGLTLPCLPFDDSRSRGAIDVGIHSGIECTLLSHFFMKDPIMWRQGDILIAQVHEIPRGATRRPNCVLAEGELTGHSHRIDQPATAELFESKGRLYLSVLAREAQVVHQEHGPITLTKGFYAVWSQREYSPESIRAVKD